MTQDSPQTTDEQEQQEVKTTASSTPSSYKILGKLSETDAAGVLGQNTSSSGTTFGVRGETSSSDSGSAGVYGEAESTTGFVNGVTGVTQSKGGLLNAAGVRGEAPSEDTSASWGVRGTSNAEGYDDNTFGQIFGGGVYGSVTPSSGNYTAGVFGSNSGTHDGASGVRGEATGESGEIYGVYGSTLSGSGYGLYTPDDAKVGGDMTVDGAISRNVGAEVELSGEFTVPSKSKTKIPFDTVVVDDRSEFNTTENKFVCDSSGSYRVEVNFRWSQQISSGTDHFVNLDIDIDGIPKASSYDSIAMDSRPSHSISRTFHDLSSGTEITANIYHNTGQSVNVNYLGKDSFLTVTYLG